MKRLKAKFNKRLFIQILKFTVFALSIALLYNELFLKEDFSTFITRFKEGLVQVNITWLVIGVSLVFFNWGAEALKWKLLIADYEKVRFFPAYRAILAGVFIGFFTPNRVGEFAGRLVYLKTDKKIEGALLTMSGNIAQLLCTVLFGLASIIYLYDQNPWPWVTWTSFFITTSALLFLYFNLDRLSWLFRLVKVPRKLLRYFIAIKKLEKSRLASVMLISIGRYLVFALQYFFFFKAFHSDITFFQTMVSLAAMFLTQTLLPTLAISEVTVRGSVALKTFAPYLQNDLIILSVTYSIWLVNMLVPALTGGILFLFNRSKDVGT
ncbi:MAG: flippase-like domain-containing protein [Bacteroidetes bacterium]|nr:MAG: flippase-like domain-containing protein [Bacteroidota bacterium]